MEKDKVKILDSAKSGLAIKAIELRETADELAELSIKLNCENVESIQEHLNEIEMKLIDDYFNVSDLNLQIYELKDIK